MPHEAADRASRDVLSLPPELAPHLAHAVDAEVRIEYAPDVGLQDEVAPGPGRQPGRVGAPGDRRGLRQVLWYRNDEGSDWKQVLEFDLRLSGSDIVDGRARVLRQEGYGAYALRFETLPETARERLQALAMG